MKEFIITMTKVITMSKVSVENLTSLGKEAPNVFCKVKKKYEKIF